WRSAWPPRAPKKSCKLVWKRFMLLVTRPQPSAADTAARLKRRGFRVVVSPQLQASFKKPRAVSAAGHIVVVTSPQAARALANWPQLHRLPALAVGDGTKKLL